MDKQVNKESLASMATLQKGYIDQGDQKNSEAISAVSEKVDGLLMGADFAVAEYIPGSTDYLPKASLGIGKDILNYFTPVWVANEIVTNGQTTQKAIPLQKNNFFKDRNGKYRRLIGIPSREELTFGGAPVPTNQIITPESDGRFVVEYIDVVQQYGVDVNDPTNNLDNWLFKYDLFGYLDADGNIDLNNPVVPRGTSYLRGIHLIKEFEKWLFLELGSRDIHDIRHYLYAKLTEQDLENEAYIDDDGVVHTYGEASNTESMLSGSQSIAFAFPWEFTYSHYETPLAEVGIANTQPLYLCDGLQGKSGRVWKGLFTQPMWDGLDLSDWKLPCTAIGCGPASTYEGNFYHMGNDSKSLPCASIGYFTLSKGMTNCQSNKGLLPVNPFFDEHRNYPRVNDMNQVNNATYARNHNYYPDGNMRAHYSTPYAEGGYFAHNVFITAMELAAGTKFIHAANLFGSGISSNDGCNANNFFISGGVRFRVKNQGDGTPGPWQYRTFGQNCAPLQYNASGATTDMSNLLTQYYPKEQCMESQMVASMATEMGIAPAVEPNEDNIQDFLFPFYGRSYYYMNVPGFDGLQEGQMNCRVYKYMREDVQAWMNGEETTFEMEVIYRMSLFMGVNLTGDIWAYYGGGLEMVGTPKEGATAGSTGNQIDIYLEPDQSKWRYIIAITTPAGTKFDFEKIPAEGEFRDGPYRHILTATNLGDSYTLTRGSYTPWKTAKASSIAQGECYYQWDNAHWISGTNRVRDRSLFRGGSRYAYCSPRSLLAHHAASATYRSDSGSAQVLVEFE